MPSESVVAALEFLGAYSTPLIWFSIAAFLAGAILEVTDRRGLAVPVAAAGWVAFGVFWVSMFHYFYFEFASPLEGVLSLAALPLALYAAYLLVSGRDSLLIVSRAIACMGLIYLPIATIEPVKALLIESVAAQTQAGMGLFGYHPELVASPEGYASKFEFEPYTGEDYTTYIVLACTGIGSISVFGGLIASVRAPLSRKVKGFVAATGIIYVLNLFRNVFVGLAAPLGWFDTPTTNWLTVTLAGEGVRTSFFVAHHLISQTLSVVALIGITLIVVRLVPEVVEPLEEVLYVLTKSEYDLAAAVGRPETARGAHPDSVDDAGSVADAGAAGDGEDPGDDGGAAASPDGGTSPGDSPGGDSPSSTDGRGS